MDYATLPVGIDTEIIVTPMSDKTLLGRLGYSPTSKPPLPGGNEIWYRQTGPLLTQQELAEQWMAHPSYAATVEFLHQYGLDA
jgi:hypothetical protein